MEEKKKLFIGFRATPSQYNTISTKCQKAGISVSEYLRQTATKSNIYIADGLPELIVEVKRIGNNINQLTKIAHSYYLPNLDVEIKNIHLDLDNIKSKLDNITDKVVT